MIARRSAAFSSSGVDVSPSRYWCSSVSSILRNRLDQPHAPLFRLLFQIFGNFNSSHVFGAYGLVVPQDRLVRHRSTTPVNFRLSPIGRSVATPAGIQPLRIVLMTLKKSAPALSILFTNAMRGTPYLFA